MFGYKVAIGFSMVSVYDAYTDWNDRNRTLINAADLSSVKSVTAGPTFAFAFNEKLSFGLGLDISYMYNEVTQGLDIASLEARFVDNNFSGFGIGAHVGLLYQFTPVTRIGLTYFSPIKYNLSGTSQGSAIIGSDRNKTVDTNQTWSMP
jgi:long-chain fatty acid transport protein